MKTKRNTNSKRKLLGKLLLGLLGGGFCLNGAWADYRRFTYSYEPEVLPARGMEFEQWITLRSQRTSGGEVKQGNYNLWELREEFEYGVTYDYSVSLYLNTSSESFRAYSQMPP